jgi:ribonuclease BN (tRNA processing enzyme)
MRIRVLGCSGSIGQGCRTTSFLIDDQVLVDAGTGVGDLPLGEMAQIDHVLLTHSHLDHIAALPLMLDAVSSVRRAPLKIYALEATIAALKTHIFNDVIWPDFAALPTPAAPFLEYRPYRVGEVLTVAGVEIEVLPSRHTVPSVGLAARGDTGWWVFSGDTEQCPPFWTRINDLPVACLFIETAFSNREAALARTSLHLSPKSLAQVLALAQFPAGRPYPVYITHTKPSETELIMEEIEIQGRMGAESAPVETRQLRAGDVIYV